MEFLENIFVPYKIAQKLKEIEFEEPCIAYYDDRYRLYMWHDIMTKKVDVEEELSICNFNEPNPYHNIISAPTWEQVKKWFRSKLMWCKIESYHSSGWGYQIETINKGYSKNDFKTYEEAREQLILKLIEIYEKGK